MQNQYTEPESKIQERMEHFFIKQGKILLLEMITGSLFLIILLGSFFIPKPLVLSRNPFGEGTKEISLSLKKDKQRKKIILQMGEMRLSSGEAEKIYQEFFKKLEKKISGKNASLHKVQESLYFPENIQGYPFELSYDVPTDGYIYLDGTLNKKAQRELKKGESYKTSIQVTAKYHQYQRSMTYKIEVLPKSKVQKTGIFYEVQNYLKKKEKQNQYKETIRIPASYKDITIEKTNKGNNLKWVYLFILVSIFVPVYNYLKLHEDGKRCQIQAEKDFPVIVHLLTLYMGAGLSFYSAIKRISNNYKKQEERGEKRIAFEKIMLMEQQMNNGISQKKVCQNWGRQFQTDSYQKLSLILIQSFTKGSKEAAILMEAEEREAFRKRVDRAKKEGEEAATRLLFPMILLLCQVMLLVMYPALIKFQGF